MATTALYLVIVLVSQAMSAAVDTDRLKRASENATSAAAAAAAAASPANDEASRAANLQYDGRPIMPVLPPQVQVPYVQYPAQPGPMLPPPPPPQPMAVPMGNQYPVGGPSLFGPLGAAYHLPDAPQAPLEIPMKVLNTNVDCQKTQMVASFKLSRPFFGYIYPYGNFDKCILFAGRGEMDISLKLGHDMCGKPEPVKVPGYSYRVDPVIEHRLMIQWDTDLVQEYDTNVLVRCDRPDDYNRTVAFDLSSVVGENQQVKLSTHPGPQMWMEIQRGEGPRAQPLMGPVYLGETLTMVFTLADDVFRFDSNVVSCRASDGSTDRQVLAWTDPDHIQPPRPLLTNIHVIENACSIKPKLFGNFLKVKEEYATQMTTTSWAYFKAIRFPTSARLVIQCEIQVCYDKCYQMPPCSLPYDARSAAEGRKRRAAENMNQTVGVNETSPIPAERMTMFRAIEVLLPEDIAAPMAIFNSTNLHATIMARSDCVTNSTFYGIVLGLGITILLLIGFGAAYVQRQNKKSSNSPRK